MNFKIDIKLNQYFTLQKLILLHFTSKQLK